MGNEIRMILEIKEKKTMLKLLIYIMIQKIMLNYILIIKNMNLVIMAILI